MLERNILLLKVWRMIQSDANYSLPSSLLTAKNTGNLKDRSRPFQHKALKENALGRNPELSDETEQGTNRVLEFPVIGLEVPV